MRKALVKSLNEIAGRDPRIILLTADLGFMVLEPFRDAYPDRFFNVGVAEANMIGLATGLAASGYIPFVYSIATFSSMRGYEQIRNGPVLHELPVRIVGVGGGFEYGHGGITHHALEDLSITRVQPGLKVIVPADCAQAETALKSTYDLPGPIYFRLGKRDDLVIPGLEGRFRLGRLEILKNGQDILIVTLGAISSEALKAAEDLEAKNIGVTVALVSSLKPSPEEDLSSLLPSFQTALVVEEHYRDGALGSLVCEIAAETGSHCRIKRLGVTSSKQLLGDQDYLR